MPQYFLPSGEWVPYDYETLTVSITVVTPTAAKIAVSDGQNPVTVRRARAVLISVRTNPVGYRIDGGNPTAADSHELQANDEILIEGVDAVRKLKFIRTGAADGTVNLTYFRTA